jgi:hypothetical protein
MKLKTVLDINFIQSLNTLIGLPLPLKASYWLGKVHKKISKEVQTYHEARLKGLKKYTYTNEAGSFTDAEGKEIELGAQAVFKSESDRILWDKDHEALVEIDLEIEKIKIQLLGDDTKIEARLLSALDELFEE